MESFTLEEFDSVVALIKQSAPPNVSLINAHVRTDRGSKKALSSQNIKTVKLSKDVREFSVADPCYVKFIDIYGGDVSLLERRIAMTAVKVDGSRYKVAGKTVFLVASDGKQFSVVRYQLGYFCTSIEVTADSFLKSIALTKFMVYGYSIDQLDQAAARVASGVDLVSKIDKYVATKKQEAGQAEADKEAAEVELADLQSEISDLEEQKTAITADISDLDQRRIDLDAKRLALEGANVEAQARLTGAKNNEEQLRQSVQSLNRDISGKQRELKDIVNDRSLISDEYRDYVVEGKKQSDVYAWFLYFSIAVIALAAWQLYAGAQRILEADVDNYRQVAAMVLQRVPFAAAVSVVLAVAWKLASMFVSRIMAIHSQRLALARLLVIAKDTVYSSADGLDVTDEEKFRERIRLKLVMLRSHLTSELGKEFEYPPSKDRRSNSSDSSDEDGESEGDGE